MNPTHTTIRKSLLEITEKTKKISTIQPLNTNEVEVATNKSLCNTAIVAGSLIFLSLTLVGSSIRFGHLLSRKSNLGLFNNLESTIDAAIAIILIGSVGCALYLFINIRNNNNRGAFYNELKSLEDKYNKPTL